MASTAALNAFQHAYAENGSQGSLRRRQRISIRFHAGEYGLRDFMIHPCCFQYGIRSSHAALRWMEAWSTTTTVFFVIV